MHKIFTGKLQIETVTVSIAGLPKELQGLQLVQMSDLHYEGWGLSKDLLTEAIALSNQMQPDIVVLTGDYVIKEPEAIYSLISQLKHLQSHFGVYAILGNHDVEKPSSQTKITNALNSIGISVLWNQVIYPFGSGLALVGMAELQSGQFKPELILNQIPVHTPRIVLSHNPDTALAMRKWRVDLQLSGHTHGSQIILPKLGPLPNLLKQIHRLIPNKLRRRIPYISDYYTIVKHWEWYQGFHQVGNNNLYVNRGLGTFFPGRLFCPPEVTLIKLVTKPALNARTAA